MRTEIFDDLAAEHGALEETLASLPDAAWAKPSAAPGWSVADVVLHLAQGEEAVAASVGAHAMGTQWREYGDTVEQAMEALVRAERAEPMRIFERWRLASRAALRALRTADPATPLRWVASPLKPPTLATTRLAEHWAHALDIAGPLGLDYPDTPRLRHIAWLGHSTLPYAFIAAGEEPREVYCELTGPDGATWTFGPPGADSSISGTAAAFCRVGARRLAADESGLVVRGPHARAALRLLRNYAI